MKNFLQTISKLPLWSKIIIIGLILVGGYFGFTKFVTKSKTKVTYQTSTVEKGSLMTTISASGTITSGDTTYVTTGATGTVSKVYVKNGDTVKKGQRLADIDLDDDGRVTQVTAWNNYQEALVRAENTKTSKVASDINVDEKYQAMIDAERAQRDAQSGGWNPNTKAPYTDNELKIVKKQYTEAIAAYQAAQKDYSISDSNISLDQSKASATYRNYQQVSGTIYAPASGIINNLVLAPGVVLSNNSNSSITVSTGTDTTSNSQSVSSQKIGAIKNPNGQYQATVNLTEVDVTKVKSSQKVTLLLDAYPDNTLSGTVLAVNTSGSVSSGVTSYSAAILLDKTSLDLYTNMAVTANIIISSKDNVLLVPSSAIHTSGETSYVEVQKNGQISTVNVQTGDSNDTQTEIVSGLNEGDVVVTSSTSSSSSQGSSTNLFSGSNNRTNGSSGNRGGNFIFSGGPGGPGF